MVVGVVGSLEGVVVAYEDGGVIVDGSVCEGAEGLEQPHSRNATNIMEIIFFTGITSKTL